MILSSCDRVNDLWLCIGNDELDRQRPTKLLSFIMNASLSWQDHIDAIYKNVQRNVYLLQHSRYFLDRTSARTFYFQFIYCHLLNNIHIIATCQAIMPWTDCFCYKSGLFLFLHMYITFHIISHQLSLSYNHYYYFLFLSLFAILPTFLCGNYNFLSPPFIYKRFKINDRSSLRDKHLLVYPTD